MNETYFHINNGGLSVAVEDSKYGPTLKLLYGHFGIYSKEESIVVSKAGLKELGEMLIKASEGKFTEHGNLGHAGDKSAGSCTKKE